MSELFVKRSIGKGVLYLNLYSEGETQNGKERNLEGRGGSHLMNAFAALDEPSDRSKPLMSFK